MKFARGERNASPNNVMLSILSRQLTNRYACATMLAGPSGSAARNVHHRAEILGCENFERIEDVAAGSCLIGGGRGKLGEGNRALRNGALGAMCEGDGS